jgi:hypothetical protein
MQATLKAEYGRKGPEGILQVVSKLCCLYVSLIFIAQKSYDFFRIILLLQGTGGYFAKHPTSLLVHGWSLSWVAMRDTQILIFSGRKGPKLIGTVLIDQGLVISCSGSHITVKSNTRTFTAQASSEREAHEWVQAALSFYSMTPRSKPHPFGSSFPVRLQTDARTYETSSKLYQNAAISMLKAAESIFICANELYPGLILTRPPLPTVRLDQILKFKADQGVKINVLLFKEVYFSCASTLLLC